MPSRRRPVGRRLTVARNSAAPMPPRSSAIWRSGSPCNSPPSRANLPLAGAIRYALARMERLRPYLDHGILELDNNAAERGMRAIALGRKNYLFVGSEAGGKAAAIAYTLIETEKLNALDPHAWLADTLARIPDYKINKVVDLLP
ncbi:IS66 family transposase [Paracoccus yeei]|uniref:IS66 family transposase n=1 Tax=Paracoccus yeei TaxID=147645 RepID=UPI0030B8DC41